MRVFILALVAFAVIVAPADAYTKTALADGAWCWFADPRAVAHNGHTYIGAVASTGDIVVTSINHITGRQVRTVLRQRLHKDDHANPALQVRPDGRLRAYYSQHHGGAMYYRESTVPDASVWGPERAVRAGAAPGYSYPNPVYLADERRTYLFWRGGTLSAQYSTHVDGGTWTPARNLIVGSTSPWVRPYVKYSSNGQDTIQVAFTNAHPMEADDVNIYFAAIRDGKLWRADGSLIGPLEGGLRPADADVVFDRPENAWVHDVAVGPDGHPVVVFATFPTPDAHRYYYARWTGTAWSVRFASRAGGSFSEDGQVYYLGGITLDHEDPSRVYLSREISEGNWQIVTATTSDNGATWTGAMSLATSGKNVRPISPRGLKPFDGPMSVLWMAGKYASYVEYRTNVAGYLPRNYSAPLR